ncbi:hypothetical protein Thermus77420_14000 [Thermus thalpophilus]
MDPAQRKRTYPKPKNMRRAWKVSADQDPRKGKRGPPVRGTTRVETGGMNQVPLAASRGRRNRVNTRYPMRRLMRRTRGAPVRKRPKASALNPTTLRLARAKRRKAKGRVA